MNFELKRAFKVKFPNFGLQDAQISRNILYLIRHRLNAHIFESLEY